MNRLIFKVLLCIFITSSILLNAQNSYSDKKVNFPGGHITLKAALKILSDQTHCVFSYDPTKINEKQELTISKFNKLTLHAALQKILPKSIQFKFTGKYIVLQKPEFPKTETPVKALATPSKSVLPIARTETRTAENLSQTDVVPILKEDSAIQQPKITATLPVSKISFNDSVASLPNFQPEIKTSVPDTFKIIKPRSKSVFELEFAENNHLATISTHIGLNDIYSIISIGSDYNKSYHFGLGAGMSFQFSKHLNMNIDLIQYALAGGKSFKLKVRAATTQFSPMVNYSILKRLKLFAGPSLYLIKTRYLKGNPTPDLGKYVGYSAIFGIKIDLTKSQKTKI